METCKTCYYWAFDEKLGPEMTEWGRCKKMDADPYEPEYLDTLAVSHEQDEAVDSWVMTNEDFGCNMHPDNGGVHLDGCAKCRTKLEIISGVIVCPKCLAEFGYSFEFELEEV